MTVGYSEVHRRLGRRDRGTCSCGKPAIDWAYMGCDEEMTETRRNYGRILQLRFCQHPEHYTGMCRRCHQLLDSKYPDTCPSGHSNWRARSDGRRECIDCARARCRTYYEKTRGRR